MKTVEFYSTDFVFAASGGIDFLPLHFVSRAPGVGRNGERRASNCPFPWVAASRWRLSFETF